MTSLRAVASRRLDVHERQRGELLAASERGRLLDDLTRDGGHLDRITRAAPLPLALKEACTVPGEITREKCMPLSRVSKRAARLAASGASEIATRGSGRRASAALDNLPNNVSGDDGWDCRTVKLSAPQLADYQRHRRHVNKLRRTVQGLTASSRVRGCGRRVVPDCDVGIRQTASGVAHFTGFRSCGRAWLCARCAGAIGTERAGELHRALTRHLDAGGDALFLTLTMPHDDGDELRPMLKLVSRGFTAMLAGRHWSRWRRQFGIIGTVRTLEVTHGAHGWHPHLHVLVLTEGHFTQRERAALRRYTFTVWSRVLASAGRRVPRYKLCPMRVVGDRTGMAAYLNKVAAAYEMTSWHRKRARGGSRTFFDLVAAVARGDRSDATVALIHEWERATFRMRAVTWSHGLKRRLFVKERTDEEIAAREIGGDDLLLISPALYASLVRHNARGGDDLLEAIERGGVEAGVELLESLPVWFPGAAILAVFATPAARADLVAA